MAIEPLTIVSCKTCKYYIVRKIDAYSSIHSCKKGNTADIDGVELYCNKPCYCKKLLTNKISSKKKK